MSNLIGRKELLKICPALGERKYRLDWLIRTRQIPLIRISNRNYFDEVEIQKWIDEHSIPAYKGNTKNG